MSNKKEYGVSVLIANYNNSEYLHDFFNSLKESSVTPDEIIFVDDCSTDNSLKIIKEYELKIDGLKVYPLPKNVGFANALNFGLKHVTENYTLRIDPDDLLDKERIKKQMAVFKSNNKIDVVGSNVRYFSKSHQKIIGSSNFPSEHQEIIKRYKQGYHGLIHGATIIKTIKIKVTQYRQEFVPAEEYDLFSRLLKNEALVYNLKEPLTDVRIHEKSVSHNYPIATFKKIATCRKIFWNEEDGLLNFYRKYLMINFYRKSLSENIIKKNTFKILAGIMAPKLVIKRIFNLKK